MLNRRKNPSDLYVQADGTIESQRLLDDNLEGANNNYQHYHNNEFPNTNQCFNTTIVAGSSSSISNYSNIPKTTSSFKRKVRDKSPEPDNHYIKLRHITNSTSNHSTIIGNNQTALVYNQYDQNNEYNYVRQIKGENNDNNFFHSNYNSTIPRECSSIELNFNHETRNNNHSDFVFYTVQPGDTLHNLSVKYSCPVASIKRLNNLWSDQEFYGLTRVKLPTGKLRLIADVIEEINNKQEQPTNSPQDLLTSKIEQANDKNTNFFTPTSTSSAIRNDPQTIYSSFEEETNAQIDKQEIYRNDLGSIKDNNLVRNDSIFKDFDLNIKKARLAALSYNDNASAIMQSLVQTGNIVDEKEENFSEEDLNDPNKLARREAEILLNDMSDFGLSYSGLILFIFIVCLIFPLAYVIYLEETHTDSKKIT